MAYRKRNARGEYPEVDAEEPENPILHGNMQRLMAGRSIETVRAAMAEAGVHIGTGTLHKAVQGKSGNRLASLKKIAEFFGVSVDQLLQPDLGKDLPGWPFSMELYERVAKLNAQELQRLETGMRVHLGMSLQMERINRILATAEGAEAFQATENNRKARGSS